MEYRWLNNDIINNLSASDEDFQKEVENFILKNMSKDEAFVVSQNLGNIKKILQFFNSETSTCLIDGKTGSCKTSLVKFSTNFFSDDVLLFKFKFFEGNTLDDIFLSFFEDMKKYAHQKKLSFSKIETNSLSQRINTYLSHIKKPVVIVFDSLENVYKKNSAQEKEEIFSFIEHLESLKNFKTILISSGFESGSLNFEKFESLSVQPYTKEQVEAAFKHYELKYQEENFEKYFEIAGGNTNYLYQTIDIILSLKTSLDAIVAEFSLKNISYDDFIYQKIMTFVPEKVKQSLYILSMVNIGLSVQYLLKSNFFTQEQVSYMLEKGVLVNEYGCLFIKPGLKKFLQSYISHLQKLKIHSYWKDFYYEQLPQAPNNRVVLISRNTMRTQIDYHNKFVPEESVSETEKTDMSLMSYLNSNLTAWNIKNTNASDSASDSDEKKRPKMPDSLKQKSNSLEKYELTKDEVALLSVPVDLKKQQEKEVIQRVHDTIKEKEKEKKQSVVDLLNLANDLASAHCFDSALFMYEQALENTTDKDFLVYQRTLLEKAAFCLIKLGKGVDAIEYYNRLIELYDNDNEQNLLNETRLKIAQIYKDSYKFNHARVIYENFVNKKTTSSDSIMARSLIGLASIEEEASNIDKAIEYYKKSFALKESVADSEIYTEAYFKYALILDDYNQTEAALDYYQKCIHNSSKPSVFASSAYTNLAEIIKEQGKPKKALEYYKNGLKIDIAQENFEGVYYICLKIAQTCQEIDPKEVKNWLLKSLSAAKRAKEKIYITNAYIELSEYYSEEEDYQKALKALFKAKLSLNNMEYNEAYESNINQRIEDMKSLVPKNIVDKIASTVFDE